MFDGVSAVGWLSISQFILVISVAISTSYTDLKKGVIRNSHVGLLTVLGGAAAFYRSYADGMLI